MHLLYCSFTCFTCNISRKCIRRDKIFQVPWKFSFSLYYLVSRFSVGFPYLILFYLYMLRIKEIISMVSWFTESRHSRWFYSDISVAQKMVKNRECNRSNLWQPVTSIKVANSPNWNSAKFFLKLSETLNLHAV